MRLTYFRMMTCGVAAVVPSVLLLLGCGGADPVDTNIFRDLRAEELSPTSAVVRFETTIETTCEVEYGPAGESMTESATDPTMSATNRHVRDHNVPLFGLTPETAHDYRARAVGIDGTVYISDVATFSTLVDNTPPNTLNVAALGSGTTVIAVSSNFGGAANDATWGINNALDGDVGTEWATNGDGDAAYAALDFGQARELRLFRFRSRQMQDGSSIIEKVRLVVTDVGGGATILGPYDTPDPATLYSFELDPPVTTQEVRVEAVQTTGGNTGAREIQLLVNVP